MFRSNGSRIACNSTFKSKRRRAVPAAKPLGKQPRFVVARSANPICRHIWNSICGIAAMLTNRVFAHKSPGTPACCTIELCHLPDRPCFCYNVHVAKYFVTIYDSYCAQNRRENRAVLLGGLCAALRIRRALRRVRKEGGEVYKIAPLQK